MSVSELRAALLAEGGTLAEHVGPVGWVVPDAPVPQAEAPSLAAAGPRAATAPGEYELLLEMILEGSLLHYRQGRVLAVEDPDLALLLGDHLYALGLSRLAALGDITAVAELGDLISLVAQAEAAGNQPLVAAVWRAGATAIGWGATPAYAEAKAAARRGEDEATEALTDAAEAVLPPSVQALSLPGK